MSGTAERDRVGKLAKSDPRQALEVARTIEDPWFRAQALSDVARYTSDDPIEVAREAEAAALQCDDQFKRSAVRAWEIAALAERDKPEAARRSLDASLNDALQISPVSSRCESLALLLHAAARISITDTVKVAEAIRRAVSADGHWRCVRAIKDAAGLLAQQDADTANTFAAAILDETIKAKCLAAIREGKTTPRPFYW